MVGPKKQKFLAKNQHTQRKPLYFANTGNASLSKFPDFPLWEYRITFFNEKLCIKGSNSVPPVRGNLGNFLLLEGILKNISISAVMFLQFEKRGHILTFSNCMNHKKGKNLVIWFLVPYWCNETGAKQYTPMAAYRSGKGSYRKATYFSG